MCGDMRKLVDYVIVSGPRYSDGEEESFISKVKSRHASGYEMIGGASVYWDKGLEIAVQAMAKYEDEKIEDFGVKRPNVMPKSFEEAGKCNHSYLKVDEDINMGMPSNRFYRCVFCHIVVEVKNS